MSDLIGNNPIAADGEYDLPVVPGKPVLFTLKGAFASATVVLSVRSNVDTEVFDDVDGGSWTAPMEDTLIPSGSIARLTVTGATGGTSIRASFIPIRYTP